MAMSREEMDRYDREINGIYAPPVSYRPQPSPPMADVEGRPITASYSLDDIRRFLGIGSRPAMSPAEAADAAQMYERLPNPALPPTPPGGYDAPSPSIPPMPSTDPRGAAAPIPPPPRPAAPARPRAPRGAPGAMPANVEAMPMPDIVPPATPGAMPVSVEPMLPQPAPVAPPAPVALANPTRPSPQRLAEILRGRGMPFFPAPVSPGWESQISGAPMAPEPVIRMRR